MLFDFIDIDRLLKERFGNKVLKPHREPIGELIRTILSQNTTDTNRDRAYERLRKKFPVWGDILKARTDSIKTAIKPGGLSGVKAPRIKIILQQLSNGNGTIDLSFLEKMPVKSGIEYLTSFKGVGVKTAACVLLFSYGKKLFPVDTHIYRISQRLGLVTGGCGREKTFEILNDIIPNRLFYRLHLNLIELGRKTCRSRNPLCNECSIDKYCQSAFSFVN